VTSVRQNEENNAERRHDGPQNKAIKNSKTTQVKDFGSNIQPRDRIPHSVDVLIDSLTQSSVGTLILLIDNSGSVT
jgi:hypothetical protein